MQIHVILLVVLSCTFAYALDQGPLVNTTSGRVRGFYPRSSVEAFLGIPYAQPPIGLLRFAAPQACRSNSSQEIIATEFGKSCLQAPVTLVGGPVPYTVGMSEDCLTLNIWSHSQSTGLKRPVLIFVHGGGGSEGATSVPLYNGLNLADANPDIVVATFNYRLNIFGFPNAPGLNDQNLGYRDARFAIEWLRDNIAAFGGDPDRMVAAGESAGSSLLSVYPYAYPDDPILKGIVTQSGTLFNGATAVDNGTYWRRVVNATSCKSSNGDSQAEIACVRAVDPYDIVRIVQPAVFGTIDTSTLTYPIVDNVTVFAPGAYLELTQRGRIAKIPQLIGSNKDEANIFGPATPQGLLDPNGTALITANAFTCPSASQSAVLANASIPVWRYYFMGGFPSQRIYPWIGAFHGSELAPLFGNLKHVQVRDPQPWELSAAAYMQSAWVSFVKDPQNGLTKLGWPKYDPNRETLVRLIENQDTNVSFTRPDAVDAICSAIRPSGLTKRSLFGKKHRYSW